MTKVTYKIGDFKTESLRLARRASEKFHMPYRVVYEQVFSETKVSPDRYAKVRAAFDKRRREALA